MTSFITDRLFKTHDLFQSEIHKDCNRREENIVSHEVITPSSLLSDSTPDGATCQQIWTHIGAQIKKQVFTS